MFPSAVPFDPLPYPTFSDLHPFQRNPNFFASVNRVSLGKGAQRHVYVPTCYFDMDALMKVVATLFQENKRRIWEGRWHGHTGPSPAATPTIPAPNPNRHLRSRATRLR
jgi:hypothetical protein